MARVGRVGAAGLACVMCLCLMREASSFLGGVLLPSSLLTAHRSRVARGGCGGGLQMAKHAQHKATKKHVKNRPKKKRPSDRNRTPATYSVEIENNWVDAPPVFGVEGGEEKIGTKASVIESKACAMWDKDVARMSAEMESREDNELDGYHKEVEMLRNMAKDLGLPELLEEDPWEHEHCFMSKNGQTPGLATED